MINSRSKLQPKKKIKGFNLFFYSSVVYLPFEDGKIKFYLSFIREYIPFDEV